jgi:fido (protein-threonine AMPylation protein)
MCSEEMPYTRINKDLPEERKRYYWDIAFGLQDVDNKKPSEYLRTLAAKNVRGEISYEGVQNEITEYYDKGSGNPKEREPDLVSVKIEEMLRNDFFKLDYKMLKAIHGKLFAGGFDGYDFDVPVGEFRNYNISKDEPILNYVSVRYADHGAIEDTLAYDFAEEKSFDYSILSDEEKAYRIMDFISRIWQVHAFGEGNTRTIAVFAIKYLQRQGFEINNEPFKKHSKYFRDALVRANYGKNRTDEFLKKFTDNALFGKGNVLNGEDLNL